MARFKFLFLLLALGLSGCALTPDGTVGIAGPARVLTNGSPRTWTIIGDGVSNGIQLLGTQYGWHITSVVDKATGIGVHALYVDASYHDGWNRYDSASDDEGNELEVMPYYRSKDLCSKRHTDCMYNESFRVDLPDTALRSHAFTGYRIMVSSKYGGGDWLVVTKEQIQEQYAAIAILTGQRALPNPAPTPAPAPAPAAKIYTAPHVLSAVRTLGVKVVPTPGLMAPLLGVKSHEGAWVIHVDDGSMAAGAGIDRGNVILSVNGAAVNDADALEGAIKAVPVGQAARIGVLQGNETTEVTIQF